jgi:hypothetical protein
VLTEFVYDLQGRTVGTRRTGDGGSWTCSYFDARGRTTSTAFPAYGGSPARTATYTYKQTVTNDPRFGTAHDPAGTITTQIDLLGRTTVSTDVLHDHLGAEDAYLRGIELGDCFSATNMGIMLIESGNLARAREWLEYAQERGDTQAAAILAQQGSAGEPET